MWPSAHIHQRTAEWEAVDDSFHRNAALALKNFDDVKGRLDAGGVDFRMTDELGFEFVLRHRKNPFVGALNSTIAQGVRRQTIPRHFPAQPE
jgi:hypothetical protein